MERAAGRGRGNTDAGGNFEMERASRVSTTSMLPSKDERARTYHANAPDLTYGDATKICLPKSVLLRIIQHTREDELVEIEDTCVLFNWWAEQLFWERVDLNTQVS